MIYGNFKSNDNITYTVNINCDYQKEIGTASLYFGADPIEIKQDIEDTFDHILKTQAFITLVTKDYIGNYIFTSDDRAISVTIKNGEEIVFSGYVTALSYNQDFADYYTEITISCNDYLCTLENHKYKESHTYSDIKANATNISFYNLLFSEIFNSVNKTFLYDNSLDTNIFSKCGISELLFLGDEEDDVWTQQEILHEILQYLNLHIIQIGDIFYIFNWNSIKNKNNTWVNLKTNATITKPITELLITTSHYKSDDTQVSIAEVYNNFKIKCDLKDIEEIFEAPLDDDSLVSPYNNKNLLLSEKLTDSDDELKDWYFQLMMPKNWKLRYYEDDQVKDVSNLVEYENNTTAINQYKIPEKANSTVLFPFIGSFGNVEQNKVSDNTITSSVSMDNYLCIHIGGKMEQDNSVYTYDSDATISKWNTISEACNGLVEFNSSTTAGVISPSSNDVINYIVFSGKIQMNPKASVNKQFIPYPDYINKIGGGWKLTTDSNGVVTGVTKDGEITANWYKQKYTNQTDSGKQDESYKSLLPCVDYLEDKYREYYGGYFTYKTKDGVDMIYQIPVLICQLQIGNKYCVQTDGASTQASEKLPTFEWLTLDECTTRNLEPTFTLGINPKVDAFLLANEFDITNTIRISDNVDAEGTAIPIHKSDNLSGKVTFKILSPCYIGWNQLIRKHPTLFRHTSWWTTTLPMMEYVDNLWVKDFKCELKSDNAKINNIDEKDLIYTTDVPINSIKKKDDITFKFNTALTAQECVEKGISTVSKISYVINLLEGNNLLLINSKYSSYSDKNKKPEEHYINDYYDEYSNPKIIIDTTLDLNNTSVWNIYKFNYFANKKFYPIARTINLKNDTIKYKLKEM